MDKETRTRIDLGRTNRRAVLSEPVLNGPLSRTEIAKATGLTTATVSRITRDLIEAGLLMELSEDMNKVDDGPRSPGRRFVHLDVNAPGGYVLGIGVNVFSQSVTLADLKNRRLARVDLKLSDLTNPNMVIERLTETANAMVAEHVIDRRRLLGASVAFTGAVDPDGGVVRTSPYLRWGEVALGGCLTSALGIPVRIESLPAALALAESRFGIALGVQNLLTINCSLGIGASLIMDGRLIRGHNFSVGLIGGIAAPGVQYGTIDIVAGGHGALMRIHGDALDIPATPANELAERLLDALDLATSGDNEATKAVTNAGHNLGKAILPFIGLLHPEAIMIAGPMATAPCFVEACRKALAASDGYTCDLKVSAMSAQAAARWVSIDEFLLERDLNLDDLKISQAA